MLLDHVADKYSHIYKQFTEQFFADWGELKKSYVKQITSKLIAIFCSILTGAFIARLLGPDGVGKIAYVSALTAIFAPIASLGVRESYSLLICKVSPASGLLEAAFCGKLLGTLLISLVLIPLSILSGSKGIVFLMIFSILATFFRASDVIEAELLHIEKGDKIASVGIIQAIFASILSLFGLLSKASIFYFGAIPAIHELLRCMLLIKNSTISSFRNLITGFSLKSLKLLISKGFPLMLSNFFIVLYLKSDLVMLEWLMGSDSVGIYSIASRSSEILYIAPMLLCQTFLPKVGKTFNESQCQATRLEVIAKLYRASWILGLGITGFVVALLPSLITLIYGSQFIYSSQLVLFLSPIGFTISLGYATNTWFKINDLNYFVALKSIAGAALNILMNFLLIPKLGIFGAALATTSSHILSTFGVPFFFKKARASICMALFPFRSIKTQ